MKVAIMQPYFFPYGGYYRLFAAADLFVVYDCVQFPRRGWVHRNRLMNTKGELAWLTLPLASAAFDAKISVMRLAEDVRPRLEAALRRFPVFDRCRGDCLSLLGWEHLVAGGDLTDYLQRTMENTLAALGLKTPTVRSSTLAVPETLRGQDRILEICRRVGATTYINASGGGELYEESAFAAQNISLKFLPPWTGHYESILQGILSGAAGSIAQTIHAQATADAILPPPEPIDGAPTPSTRAATIKHG